MGVRRVLRSLLSLVDRFESAGVYVPGENNREASPWRDFGWLIALWLVAVSVLVVFFAVAG